MYKSNGDIERFKARLVSKGYSQQKGLDYHATFRPLAKIVTMRYVIALLILREWYMYQIDVYNAFV